MKVLVTGGTGFLGSHVAEQLNQSGHQVRALVRASSDTTFLKTLNDVELALGAVDDPQTLLAAVEGVDAVIHSAGLVKAKRESDFERVNAEGTRHLLDAVKQRAPNLRRFVLVSSLTAGGPSRDGTPVGPKDDPRPVTHYGRSKLAAERIAAGYSSDLPVIMLRPPTLYGPRDREVLIFFRSIKNGVLPMTTPVDAKQSMLYGPDCAAACIRAVDADIESGSLFCVDDGPPHSFLEMIEAAEAAMGRRARLRLPLPRPVTLGAAFATEIFGKVTNRAVIFTRDKCNELFEQWVSDSTDAREQLAWEPRVRFHEGIKLTIDWYKKNGWL